jgi:aminomethyltransferase
MTGIGFSPAMAIGPRVRKSPYFDATVRSGAKAFTVYNHTYMPTMYTTEVEEYWNLVEGVTLWDVTCQRQIEITGADAFEFIQLLTPRDLSICKVGDCRYVVITDRDGGIVNDAVLLMLGQQHFWLSPGDGDTLLWILGVAVNSGMDVRVVEPDVSPLQLQGPKSPAVARALFGERILDLGYYKLLETELDGIPLVVSRTGWSGELGYEIYLRDSALGGSLWNLAMAAGEDHGMVPIAPSTIRSIEGALLSYGSDITRDDNPYEIGLGRIIDLDQKDDFIGKEALGWIKTHGVQRKLVGVEIHGPDMETSNEEPWAVAHNGEIVGRITRCTHSPRLGKNIGFANVPVEHSEAGTPLIVSCASSEEHATVVHFPWFPAEKKIPEEVFIPHISQRRT